MQDYLAIVAPYGSLDHSTVQHFASLVSMPIVYSDPNYVLLSNDRKSVITLPRGRGNIIGKIFSNNENYKAVSTLSDEEAEDVRRSSGRNLIKEIWGKYVAIIPAVDGVCIFRDPSNSIPCYYAQAGHITAFSSDVKLILRAGLCKLSVNWRMLASSLYYSQLPRSYTAISGISELLGGCALTITRNGSRTSCYWSPWDYAEAIDPVGSPSEKLREIVERVHRCWASVYPNALVAVSGGLDSSIVATCLAKASANVTGLTMVSSSPLGDERVYARQICASVGAKLIEIIYDPLKLNLDQAVSSDLPNPLGKSHERIFNEAIAEVAARVDTEAFFVGAGGDNVFYLTHSARPLVDRLRAEGISNGAINTLIDICAITQASAWQVTRQAWRLYRRRSAGLVWPSVADYLNPAIIEELLDVPPDHPWLPSPPSAPLGKIGHVMMLMRAMNHVEHRDKALSVPMVSPLLSQPIMEYCLRLPSWMVCEGGVDRSVARRAFAKALPQHIVSRSAKGSPDGFIADFIDIHRSEIRERLIDGQLARHGLLDKPALERLLHPNGTLGPRDCPRLMALIDTEAWARHWISLLGQAQ